MFVYEALVGRSVNAVAGVGRPTHADFRRYPLHASGGYIAAMEGRMVVLAPEFRPGVTLGKADFDLEAERPNDGNADRRGKHFWVGSIYMPRDRNAAGLWRLLPGGSFQDVLGGSTTKNGNALSPDGRTMFFSESWHRTIWAVDYDPYNGEISPRRVHYRVPPETGRPDGAATDCRGFHWCTAFGGGRLWRIALNGQLERILPPPMRCQTMASFGGENGDVLFVNSYGNIDETPHLANDPIAGQVIELDAGIRGLHGAELKVDAAAWRKLGLKYGEKAGNSGT